MKKILKSNSNFLHSVRNFWFALQLLIVSVSLPVLSFVQVSYPNSAANSRNTEMSNSAGKSQAALPHGTVKSIKLDS